MTNYGNQLVSLAKQHFFEFVAQTGKSASPPLIFLFGWLGAQQKTLKKYAEWYSSRGFNCLITTTSISFKLQKEFIKKILIVIEAIDKEFGANNPLFFHVFSNGGFLPFNALIWTIEMVINK